MGVVAEAGTKGNGRAIAAVSLGLLAVATMPVAILGTRYSDSYELLHAGFAIPVAIVLGALAIGLARGALRVDDLRLGRAGGRGLAARGVGARRARHRARGDVFVALAVYGLLTYLGER